MTATRETLSESPCKNRCRSRTEPGRNRTVDSHRCGVAGSAPAATVPGRLWLPPFRVGYGCHRIIRLRSQGERSSGLLQRRPRRPKANRGSDRAPRESTVGPRVWPNLGSAAGGRPIRRHMTWTPSRKCRCQDNSRPPARQVGRSTGDPVHVIEPSPRSRQEVQGQRPSAARQCAARGTRTRYGWVDGWPKVQRKGSTRWTVGLASQASVAGRQESW